MKPKFAPFALVLAVAALLSIPVGATAGHWPMFGNTAGHSSSQEVDPGILPVVQRYPRKAEAGRIQTSIIDTGGSNPNTQRMVYGTINKPSSSSENRTCNVHLQQLGSGDPVGPEAGVDVCTDNNNASEADAFGDPATNGSVTPVSSSTHEALGQLYVIHNDEDSDATPETGNTPATGCESSINDIAIAQIRESDGTLIKDVAVGRAEKPTPPELFTCGNNTTTAGGGQAADGFTVNSSPVLTPPLNANGDRALFFLASKGDLVRLFKVQITAAGTDSATFSFNSRDVAGANPMASPSIAYLRDPDVGVLPYVVVPQGGTTAGGLATYRVIDLGTGPALPAQTATSGFTPHTPATPATNTGEHPGAPASGVDVTPFFILPMTKDGKTKLFRVSQHGEDTSLSIDKIGAEMDGTMGKAIAVTQPFDGTSFGAGDVVVATEKNLYILGSGELTIRERMQDTTANPAEPILTGQDGFSRTAPAVSGNFIYITRDRGAQLVLRLSDGERVCRPGEVLRPECANRADFAEDPANTIAGGNPATFAIGQPAVSSRYVQFASNRGIFVYRASTTSTEAPAVNITQPAPNAKVSGNAVVVKATATDSDGVDRVEFFLNGESIGADTNDTNDEWETTFDSTSKPDGNYQLSARAIDLDGNEGEDAQPLEIDNVADPVASFTVSPDSAQPTGTEFTFDASGSTPAATPEGQAITQYEWDWEGDGTYDFTTTDKVVKHTYATAGDYNATLRVTQTNGQDDEESRQVTVTNRPPVASFTANPNPAQLGQQVDFDGSASQDPDGQIDKYEWDFDGDNQFDQTTTGPKTAFTYQSTGRRTVKLRITDNNGTQAEVARDVEVSGPNVPPTASFSASPNPAEVNKQVVFDATSSSDRDGSIVRYEWDLDANNTFETNSGANPRTQRAYAAAGVFNVRLRVTDNSGASTETVRQVTVTGSSATLRRARPRSLSARTTPSRDRRLPFVYKTSGRLTLPSGVARVDGCAGRVTITFKVGKKTISRRTTALRSSCSYRTSVTFRDRKRIGRRTRLRVIVRFQGNKFLTPKSARTRTVRVG